MHTVLYLIMFFDGASFPPRKGMPLTMIGGAFWKKIKRPYLLWGTLVCAMPILPSIADQQATVVMLLLLPMSVAWVRRRGYELFLVVHIIFSAITLVGCF